MIVLEGPDLAGKSSLAEELFQRFKKLAFDMPPMVRHFTKVPETFDKYWGYRRCVQRDVIIDRFHMSHIAYRLMDGGHHDLTPFKYDMVDAAITNVGGIVVVLCPSRGVIDRRWDEMPTERKEMYTREQTQRVRGIFEEICRKRALMTVKGEYKFKIDLWCENDAWSTSQIADKVMEMWLDRQTQYDEILRTQRHNVA